MKKSGLRTTRKIVGLGLLIINAMLSFTSFIAVYSVVYFLQDSDNYQIHYASPIQMDLAASNPYLYIGNITVNNTGLFDFNDFGFEFELNENISGTNTWLMSYQGTFGNIEAGQINNIVMNLTNSDHSFFRVLAGLNPATINYSNVNGYLKVRGRYVFSLFDFSIQISDVSSWAWS